MEASPYCDKVRRMLHLKRRPYEVREIPPGDTLGRLRRLNPVGREPGGRVPVLEDGELTLSGSTAIARHLDARFPDPPLFPEEARDAALCALLEDWADESLNFYELFFRFGLPENASEWSRRTSEADPPLLREATRRTLSSVMRRTLRSQGLGQRPPEEVVGEFARLLGALAGLLGERDWLVGERLSLADIAVYAQISGACDTGEGSAILADHRTLMRWMERVNALTLPR